MAFVPDKPSGRFAPDQPVEQPAEQPKSAGMSIGDYLLKASQGPMGMVAGGVGRAMENFDPKTAYEVGGRVTDVTGSPLAGYAANVALQSVPVALGAGAGKQALRSGGEALYRQALKPSSTYSYEQTKKAIRTLMGEGINVTEGGVMKLQNMIEGINTQVKSLIASNPAMVNKQEVLGHLRPLIDRFKTQVNPQSDILSINKAIDEFVAHPALKQWGDDFPIQLAQKLKQGTYQMLGSKAYGELSSASQEVQKQLARGLKEEIAKAAPDVTKLNAKESALLDAHTMVLARVAVAGNRDLGGIGWLAENPKSFLAWAADRSGLIKSLIARGLYSGQIGTGVGGVAGGAIEQAMPQ